DDEGGGVFSPDGNEFYFVKVNFTTTFPRIGILCVSHWVQGKWSVPQALPFSGSDLDLAPRLSPDGNRMYFGSARPLPGSKARVLRIWSVERTKGGWSVPVALPARINSPEGRWNWGASVASNGTIYFTSDRDEPGRPQICCSRFLKGSYQSPEKLGPEINSEFSDYDPYINADESL